MINNLPEFIKYINSLSSLETSFSDPCEIIDLLQEPFLPDVNKKSLSIFAHFLKEMTNEKLVRNLFWITFYFKYPEKLFDRDKSWIPIRSKDKDLVNHIYKGLYLNVERSEKYHILSILQEKIGESDHSYLSDLIWIAINPKTFKEGKVLANDIVDSNICRKGIFSKGILIFYEKNRKILLKKVGVNGLKDSCHDYVLNDILKEDKEETYKKYINFCNELLNNKNAVCKYHIRFPLAWDKYKKYVTEAYIAVKEHDHYLIDNLTNVFTVLYTMVGLINNKFSYFIGKKIGIRNKQLKLLKEKSLKGNKLIGESPKTKCFEEITDKIAKLGPNLIISGDYGTGKSFIARRIHHLSYRRKNICIFMNENNFKLKSLEIESGTIIISKLSLFSYEEQISLRDFIKSPLFKKKKKVLKMILITDGTLFKEARKNEVLYDIILMLGEFKIECQPIRTRKEDLEDFFDFYIDYYSFFYNKEIESIKFDAREILKAYNWPCNIKEVRKVISSAVSSCTTSKISIKDLPSL